MYSQALLNNSSSSYIPCSEAELKLEELLNNPNRTSLDVCLTLPANDIIQGNFAKTWRLINNSGYKNICVAVSGGSDSDIVVDLCTRCDPQGKCTYIFCDTGLEASGTKNHLDYLEAKYHINILRLKAKKPIPLAVKEFGVPLISKNVSEYIMRLQRYDFKWEDEPLEVLLDKYCRKITAADIVANRENPDEENLSLDRWVEYNGNYYYGCVSALMWWCNAKCNDGKPSKFDINHNPYLKEFIISKGGIDFPVANKCCKYAKKDVIKEAIHQMNFDLSISGTRRAEGGARADAYKSCLSEYGDKDKVDRYRPIFWYSNQDKAEYNKFCGITNSVLYSVYKMPRTGCCGCPMALNLEKEIEAFETYEPQLYKAMNFVFGKSYEFTREYREFQKQQRAKKREEKKKRSNYYQYNLFDYLDIAS